MSWYIIYINKMKSRAFIESNSVETNVYVSNDNFQKTEVLVTVFWLVIGSDIWQRFAMYNFYIIM